VTIRRLLPAIIAAVAVLLVGAVVLSQAGRERTATGVVVDVDAAGLTDVRGFTLRTADGVETGFRIGRLENGADFPPGHLVEHVATSEPVKVFYRDEGGQRVAFRLEDAPEE
jgi:hypothetical protein